MIIKNLKIVTTLFTFLLTIGVLAQGPPRGGQGRGGNSQGQHQRGKPDASKILDMLDVNNDRVIDKEEASKDKRGEIAKNFEDIDSNADEVIDLEELEASLNDRTPRKVSADIILKQVDDNNDGTLNELEVAAKNKTELVHNFKDIDTNQDSELDIEELKAFYEKNNDKKKKRRKKN